MSIFEQVNADIKSAMLAKEREKLESLRAVKAALLLAATEKGAAGSVTDEAAIKTIQKLVKQRQDSAKIYKEQNREDLAEVELSQAEYMQPYLPKQLSEDEIKEEVRKVINQVGATSAADFGKVMGPAMKALGGKADGKVISAAVKELLS